MVQYSGVLYQVAASSIANIHSGDDIAFTCKAASNAITWHITSPSESIDNSVCQVLRNSSTIKHGNCGPMDAFTAGFAEGSGFGSTLSAQSVSSNLNETRVKCLDRDVDHTIYVIGKQ